MKGFVESTVNTKLAEFLGENPAIGRTIVNKCMEASRARAAAKKAKDLTRKKSLLDSSSLPGKLAACSINGPKYIELFLVEGDSAGGSAKQARDRRFQAILPLKGKILNVEKARFDKMISSEQIRIMIAALGTGIGDNEYDIKSLRYHKVIIMTDADVDGSHIRTLLLTFFFRQMPDLIENGHLYVAQPPLYRVASNKKEMYIKDEDEFNDFILSRIAENEKVTLETGEAIKGQKLVIFLKGIIKYFKNLQKLTRRGYSERLITSLAAKGSTDKTIFKDQGFMEKIFKGLQKEGFNISDVNVTEEDGEYEFTVTETQNGGQSSFINWEFLAPQELRK